MGMAYVFVGLIAALATQLLVTRSVVSRVQQKSKSRRLWAQSSQSSDSDPGLFGYWWSGVVRSYSGVAPPLPPKPPHRDPPPPPPPPQPQPDQVRLETPESIVRASMRCGEAIPPESILTTTEGADVVTAFVRSSYRNSPRGDDGDGLYGWTYKVEFTNSGKSAVQLLTRHWVFVDANGKSEEIKGPGARGAMPILKPGEKWEYSSGTSISTDRGSMHGWFTFESLPEGRVFSVRVGRLALSTSGSSETIPCVAAAGSGDSKLPTTSVHSTERVIVGAITEIAQRDDDLRQYSFNVDLQVNNARDQAVAILGVYWEIIDAHGQRHETKSLVTHGGDGGSQVCTASPFLILSHPLLTLPHPFLPFPQLPSRHSFPYPSLPCPSRPHNRADHQNRSRGSAASQVDTAPNRDTNGQTLGAIARALRGGCRVSRRDTRPHRGLPRRRRGGGGQRAGRAGAG